MYPVIMKNLMKIIDKINKLLNILKEDGVNILSELNSIEEGSILVEETHQEFLAV